MIRSRSGGRPRPGRPSSILHGLALGAAGVAIVPLVGVIIAALGSTNARFASADLLRYGLTSLGLLALVLPGVSILGCAAAWLVSLYRFPGRSVFVWALALPLALPAFALAYGYADLLDVGGPFRVWLRDAGLGWTGSIRNLWGAGLILTLAFYPYVYLTVRSVLATPAARTLEAARLLGASPLSLALRVGLPLARPAVAAGAALAAMETLADYGAVQFLGVQTLTTGVVRAWFVLGSVESAARLALPLLAVAALLLWLERQNRAGRYAGSARAEGPAISPVRLRGWPAALASGFCGALVTFGLLVPLGWLTIGAIDITPEMGRLVRAALNSLGLGLAGAAATLVLAGAIALGARRIPVTARLASLGYATPGAVMAIGLLVPASAVWSGFAGSTLAALALLIFAYAARLMAAAVEPLDAGLARITPAMGEAARLLGQGEAATAWKIHLPMIAGPALTAALIVFVDVLKELPATLILRPFNFDTLAVMADNYARDERLANAGWPVLAIVLLTLPVTWWLTGRIGAARG
ncbi:hypothetical protein IP78_07400 [Brevundimonas sp. AAP58]|uniref:ABC transporter permease n=1 Tax=Brevundimonas sp. AAP58 TaxID=1523422 RepID=UPI0006CCAF0C|nr:ABC transporter permease subunit [Brevundimonas sp. AAP58]KPF80285.1 hypothetical protein IP78_07400 [Brevundimonas sp. AAP58]